MDCMEGMKTFPDKYFELAIVDPPYGIGDFNQSDAKQGKVLWNDNKPNEEYFLELERISKKRIIWGANYYNCFNPGGAIVWHKGNQRHEYSDCEIASLSFQKKIDYFHFNWQSGFYRKRMEHIIHQCQKPTILYRWILKKYGKKGDKIIDTHGGSMSSVIACVKEGFEYIAFEIYTDYFDAAQKRIAEVTKQRELFVPEVQK